MILRAAVIWILLLVIAVASGTARVAFLQPRVGEHAAHVVGTVLVILVFGTVIWWATPWIVPTLDRTTLWGLGLGWVAATIAFEFLFGHYVAGHPWPKLLADYNLLAGRIWLLVLVTILVMPWVTGALGRSGG